MVGFAWLPPETNSLRMYLGAGSRPLLAAAGAWDGLAEELHAAASSFGSVTSELAGGAWQGPASAAMANAAGPYASWLTAAGAQAELAARQARAAAGAFEEALAGVVHPAVVQANRVRTWLLAVSNVFGQNAPAIAAMESTYEQMWAQDVAVMAGYHAASSAAAAQLASWQPALPNINLGVGNIGNLNVGNGNTGDYNLGNGNLGNANFGGGNGSAFHGQISSFNVGSGNIGNFNLGSGNGNVGIGPSSFNVG
ncbi:PPE family protein, partial [Mycobacterium tuberculosis]